MKTCYDTVWKKVDSLSEAFSVIIKILLCMCECVNLIYWKGEWLVCGKSKEEQASKRNQKIAAKAPFLLIVQINSWMNEWVHDPVLSSINDFSTLGRKS